MIIRCGSRFWNPMGCLSKNWRRGRGYEMLRYPAHYMKQFHPRYTSLDTLEAMSEAAGFDLWKQLFEDMRDWRNPDIPRLWPWIVVAPAACASGSVWRGIPIIGRSIPTGINCRTSTA